MLGLLLNWYPPFIKKATNKIMAKKKINTQIRMRVASASLEFVLEVSLTDCFVSLYLFACCASWCKNLPGFALMLLISCSISFRL
ncbi:hypothetical protein B0X37_07380 [Helicobacter pylori]|nr:hypothetical protein B0X37_07380 [Helicobacter pylori]